MSSPFSLCVLCGPGLRACRAVNPKCKQAVYVAADKKRYKAAMREWMKRNGRARKDLDSLDDMLKDK